MGDAEAGAVDQHVDRVFGARQPPGDRQHLVAYAQVGTDRLDGDAVLILELGRRLGQPVRIASDQDQIIATYRELTRELRSDS